MQSILLAGSGGGLTLIGAISGAGLSSGLAICVDAGDFQSYSSTSSQTWVNHNSGGGTNGFFLGVAAAVSAGDPTFNGAIGYLPAYWSVNGSQAFAGNAVGAVLGHQPGANPAWSVFALFNRVSGPGMLCANVSAGNAGVRINLSGGTMLLSVQGTAGALRLSASGDTAISSGSWHFLGASISEAMGASGGFFYLDGNYNQVAGSNNFNATISGDNAEAAGQLAIGADGGSTALTNTLANGSKLSFFAAWTRVIAKSEFDTLRSLMRGRFGL